jgi:hypothetical protein
VEVFDPASTRVCKADHDYLKLYSPDTDRLENIYSIIVCSLVAGETTYPQNCSLATAVVLSPVYTAVTWQWLCMSQYVRRLTSPPQMLEIL